MEYVAQFLKDAFYLMLVARIAVIVALIYFISRLFYTPTFAEMIHRLKGRPRNKSSAGHNGFQKVS